MKFGYTGRWITRAVWLLLLIGVTAATTTTLALGMTGRLYAGFNLPRTAGEQLQLAIILAGIWALLGAPFFTAHEVRPRDVLLRQGVLFRARIPYGDVASVEHGARRPMGLGVRWYPDLLFVVTWPANLVEIRLRRSRSFRLCGIVPLPRVHTIAVNVDDPDGFVNALRSRLPQATGL